TLKAFGSLVALYIRFVEALPPRLSPVFLEAILHGTTAVHDVDWLSVVSPTAAQLLAAWPHSDD
ncbi:hypothetical protein FISHEDRAFT_5622, partial [Fistulina hepatica ATCC 64428]